MMQNVTLSREGDKLKIEIDLTKDFGPSSSGKTTLVASTRGSRPVPGAGDLFIGINCFRKTRAANPAVAG